jgi:hypothetical protein
MELALGNHQALVNPSPAAYLSRTTWVDDYYYVEEIDITEYFNGRTVWAHRLDHSPGCVLPEFTLIEARCDHLEDWPKNLQVFGSNS